MERLKRFRKRRRLVLIGAASILLVTLSRTLLFDSHVERCPARNGSSYVTLCQDRLSGHHRTGNHLFMLSAVLDLATKTNREVAMPKAGWLLDEVFDFDASNDRPSEGILKIKRYDSISDVCPSETIQTPHFGYDTRFDRSEFIREHSIDNNSSPGSTLEICGLSQTHVHASNAEVADALRRLLYRLKNDAYSRAEHIKEALKKLMHDNRLTAFALYSHDGVGSNRPYVSLFPRFGFPNGDSFAKDDEPFVVGVHVRMGDFLEKSNVDYGLTVADGRYFRKAFEFFIQLHKRVLFVVLSDDIEWATGHFREYFYPTNSSSSGTTPSHAMYNTNDVKIVFFRDTLPQDFALLCRTNGLIISTGTFGWWAGWFNSDAKVVYYENYPRPDSDLASSLDREDYYMKHWIPMS